MWTMAAVVALLLVSPLWLGPTAKCVANSVVPGIIGTDFQLGKLWINKYAGTVSVGDLKIANPEGFSKENCVELGNLDVNVAMTSLCSKKIRIEEIVLDGLKVATTLTGGNFSKIAENASGGAEPAPEAKAEAPKAEGKKATEEKKPETEEDGGKRVQIDKLVLKNITIKYGAVPIKIPFDINLEGIGADKPEGATWQDAWNEILGAVMKAANGVADLGKAAVGAAADAAGATVDAAGAVAGAAVDAAGAVGGAAVDAAGAVAGAAVDAAGAAVDAVGDAAGKAAGAVGDAAGAAVDAVKGIFK